MQTFKDFIKRYAGINHRLGDLADDIGLDDSFPESTDFFKNLEYLTEHDASLACIESFYDAWMIYRRYPEDQTALYLSMLMEKIDILTGVNGRIADCLGDLCDGQDPDNPLLSISDSLDVIAEKLEDLDTSFLSVTEQDNRQPRLIIGGAVDTYEQN